VAIIPLGRKDQKTLGAGRLRCYTPASFAAILLRPPNPTQLNGQDTLMRYIRPGKVTCAGIVVIFMVLPNSIWKGADAKIAPVRKPKIELTKKPSHSHDRRILSTRAR
jgi:hypothetical protein